MIRRKNPVPLRALASRYRWALLAGAVLAVVGGMFIWRSFAATSVSADINGDGKVNLSDLSILLSNFGKSGSSVKGDINGDGKVNLSDLSVLLSNFGGNVGGGPAGKRGIAIAPSGFMANATMSDSGYLAGQRFELDKAVSIDRWYFIINGEGADCDKTGNTGYGYGNGGIWYGRIVSVDQSTGLPTSTVLASEKVGACAAFSRTQNEFDEHNAVGLSWVQFPALALQANTMYAFLLSNVDPDPGNGGEDAGNYMSVNLNYTRNLADLGPNGKNTLDPQAAGAVYGYTPRETTLWSNDGGSNWLFGNQMATYNVGSNEGRMWQGGYRIAGGNSVAHGWPFSDWSDNVSGGASVTFSDVPKTVTITKAGGSNDGGGSLGTITVTNTTTGQSSSTPSLGSGMQTGTLATPVTVNAGQSYRISASGQVGTGSPDPELAKAFGLGSRAPWRYETSGTDYMPMLFVLPYPFDYN